MATTVKTQGQERIAVSWEPSFLEVVTLFVLQVSVMIWELWRAGGWRYHVSIWADNPDYFNDVAIFLHRGASYTDPHSLGLPLAVVALTKLFSIMPLNALLVLSLVPALATCVLLRRLYGGAVVEWFLILSPVWLIMAVLGGTEPLFMLLWFGAFLLARREWWIAATVLAALSTGVRPVGIFAAVALIAFLVKRKEWIVLAWSSFVSTVIALLYIATAQTFASSPWFSFTLYRERAWGANGLPIALPLMAIMSSIDRLLTETRWTVWIPDFIWFAMSLVLIAFYLRAKTVRTYTVERVATLAYLVFFFCYNYDLVVAYWPRFMLPVLPVLLVSVRDRLPADRRLVWPAALLVALLASSSIVTFRSVFGFSLHR